MREISLNEVKKLSLDVLCMIHNICEQQGLHYSLTGGTLLGAVRHKGFIPWDDDIDIMMPRPDYMRFVEFVKKNDVGFDFVSYETQGDKYPYLCAKACHKETVLIEQEIEKQEVALGVYVDIFPVDGVGNSCWQAKIRCRIAQVLNGIRVTSNWTRYQKSCRRGKMFGFVRYACYMISKIVGRKNITKLVHYNIKGVGFSKSKYAGRLGGSLREAGIFPKEIYSDIQRVEFEGKEFFAIQKYHQYLTCFFGDYMELPPENKRIRHHNYIAYKKE